MDDIYLDKVLGGQTEEFRYFIRTYKDFAYNLALSVVKNEFDAEDVVQDAFINAFNSLTSFNKRSKFSSWFFKIVIHCAYKQLEKSKRMETDDSSADEVSIEEVNAITEFYEEEERTYCIQNAMLLLKSDESLVLKLHYLLENKINEISEITGWSESKTKVTLHRARKSMKIAMIKILSQHKIIS